MQLDHINICAPADLLETVRDFYCAILALEVGARPEIPIPGYWLYGAGSEIACVHLLESDSHCRREDGHLDHVAFRVDTLTAIRAELEARDIAYGYLEFPDFGLEQINFRDPAGVKVEINAYQA
jgi:catechol 2,3-dioxygenase-like lactoylglutathione lyase family enzyme